MFIELRLRRSRRWKVIQGSQWRKHSRRWVDLGNFQGYDDNGLLWFLNGSFVEGCWECTLRCVVLQRSRARTTKISNWNMTVATWFRSTAKLVKEWELILRNWWIGIEENSSFQYTLKTTSSISIWAETRNQSYDQFSAVGKRASQSSALVSVGKTLHQDVAPIGNDIELGEVSREDVRMELTKMKNHWKQRFSEQAWTRRIRPVERNKNMRIQDVYIGVLLLSKVELLVENIELNCWSNGNESESLRVLLLTVVSWHEKMRIRFQLCRDSRFGQTGATRCERKGPTACSISFLVGFVKDLFFAEWFWNVTMNWARNHFKMQWSKHVLELTWFHRDQLKVITWPTVVRKWLWEKKNDNEELSEQSTGVRIADDSALLSWHPRFAAQFMNKMGIGERWTNEWNEANSTKMEKANGAIWSESLVPQDWRGWCQYICRPRDSRNLCWSPWSKRSSVVYHQEGSHARQKLNETNIEWCLGRNKLGQFMWYSIGKWWLLRWDWLRKLPQTKEERDLHCQELWWKEFQKLNREDPTCFLLTLRLMVELEVVRVVQRWHRMVERSNKPHNAECRERIRHIIESIGKSKDKSVQDRIAETERVKEEKDPNRARCRGCTDGTWDKMWRTVRFEQEAPNTIVFNHTCVSGVSCEWWETSLAGARPCAKFRPCCWWHTKFLRWMYYPRWTDERVVTSSKCWIGNEKKILEIPREVSWVNWLSAWYVSTPSREKLDKLGNLGVRKETRTSWWMKNSWRTAWWMPKVIRRFRWIYPCTAHRPKVIGEIRWWEVAVVVGWNSKQGSISCDTLFGESFWECRSPKEEIDVTSWRSSCGDAMLQATAFCWSLLVDMRRGENPWWGNWRKNQPRSLYEDQFVSVTFRRCNQNQTNTYEKQQVCFTSSWRSNLSWRAILQSMPRKFGREIGWILRCRLRCWTRTLQNWLQRFWRHFVNKAKKTTNWMQLKRSQDQCQKFLLSTIRSWKRKILGWCKQWVSARRSCVGCETWRDRLGAFRRCLQDCSNARVQGCGHETVGLDLGGHRQVCGSNTQENSVEVVCKRIQNEEAR